MLEERTLGRRGGVVAANGRAAAAAAPSGLASSCDGSIGTTDVLSSRHRSACFVGRNVRHILQVGQCASPLDSPQCSSPFLFSPEVLINISVKRRNIRSNEALVSTAE